MMITKPTRQDALDAIALVKDGEVYIERSIDQSLFNGAGGHVIRSQAGKFGHVWGIDAYDPDPVSNASLEGEINRYWLSALPNYANQEIKEYLNLHPHCPHTIDEDGVIELTDDDDKVHFLLSMPGASL